MIDHIAINCSSESGVEFYTALGFGVKKRIQRPEKNDVLIWMTGHDTTLELFVGGDRPQRVSEPEAYGLRHLAIAVTDFDEFYKKIEQYSPEKIRINANGVKTTFVKDPDGQPVEIREYKKQQWK